MTRDGSEKVVLSSWRRRLVDGGVGEREGGGIMWLTSYVYKLQEARYCRETYMIAS
jgi:hypothetical protein